MNAIDFISLFDLENTGFALVDDNDNELYSGNGRRCMAWLMKNKQYDIFPEQGGIWAAAEINTIVIYLTKIFD